MAEGLVAGGEEPFVSEQSLQQLDWPCSGSTKEQVKQTLSAIRKRLPTLHISEEKSKKSSTPYLYCRLNWIKKSLRKSFFKACWQQWLPLRSSVNCATVPLTCLTSINFTQPQENRFHFFTNIKPVRCHVENIKSKAGTRQIALDFMFCTIRAR